MITTDRITVGHLKRKAYLYVRQSTLYQTEQNPESLERQYDFQRQALSLGWHQDQIVTLDEDLGQSGAEATHRTDFQRLVADVGLGQVGVVLSLEISRLARNSADWHRLLELCAMTDTLILDEDGLYDPNQFNDRLLLGLRGTMSEAELHFLRARLDGGKLNKARRGELRTMLPAGLIYDPEGHVQLDPDRQVQQAIHKVFELFERLSQCLAGRVSTPAGPDPAARAIADRSPGRRDDLDRGELEPSLETPEEPSLRGHVLLSAGHANGRAFPLRPCPPPNGRFRFPTPIPATSLGSSSRPTSRSLRRTILG